VLIELTGLLGRLFRTFRFLLHNAENFVLAHDQIFFAVHLDVAAGIFAEQNSVADFDIDRNQLSIIEALAVPDGDDLGLLRLFLGRIGDNDAAALWFLVPQSASPQCDRRVV
jgi:hypothetical protein